MSEKIAPNEEIVRIQIPDDDAHNWVTTLQEGGFSSEEIDRIMTHLNKTWRTAKKNEIIKEKFDRTVAWLKSINTTLGDAQKERLIKELEEEFDLDQ